MKKINLLRMRATTYITVFLALINLFLLYILGNSIFNSFVNIFLFIIIGELFTIIVIMFLYFTNQVNILNDEIKEMKYIIKSIREYTLKK